MIAAEYGEVVDAPEKADAAVLRAHAPYEQRDTMFEDFFHTGSLDFGEETREHIAAKGKLPLDVPRSMDAVVASRPDVPFDTENPLFRFGHGLSL